MPKKDNMYVELFYDHYKDTFEQIKGYIKRRNTYSIIVLALIVFLSFQTINPELANLISTEVVYKNIGNVQIDFEYVKTVLFLALLWVLATYYRTILTIEKHYTYIHEIEEKLSNIMSPFQIEREGKSYLNHYPYLLNVIDKLYTIFFPISIILFVIFKWINEKTSVNVCLWNFWINTFIYICIIVISLLYLSHKHFKDFKKK